MSDDRSDEVEPDAAALDELLRAFTPNRTDGTDPAEPEPGDDRSAGDRAGEDDPTDTRAEAHAASSDDAHVIAIEDDELPDAVYVEGDLGGPGKQGRRDDLVFIDDDDTGDTVALDAAGGGPTRMEPRIRDRRNAVRRAADQKRFRWMIVVAGVLVVVVAALAVLGSPLFSIAEDRVRITGAVYTDRDRLGAVVDDLVGTPVLIADTRAAELELEQIPWVDTARVRTHFPRGASIEIRERSPMATFQGPDGRFRVIDRAGRVLDVLDGQPIAYMLVTGPDPVDAPEGAFAPTGYAAAAELVQALSGSVRGRVAAVDVTADGSQLRLLLDDGTEVRFGAANDLLVKLVRLENVIDRADDEGARVIDVSTAEVTLQ